MSTPSCVLEKDGISAAGMIGEILAFLEQEAKREAEEEEAEVGVLPEGEEEPEKIVWTLEGILDHVRLGEFPVFWVMSSFFVSFCDDNFLSFVVSIL